MTKFIAVDIMNELPEQQFAELDDLLAFVSIYEDRQRLAGYRRLLRQNQGLIKGQVCVDAGCGFGYLSELLVKLGARKVYAVEANPQLWAIAHARLQSQAQIQLIHSDIRAFVPEEPIAVLVHEFFGQLLYDEDVDALDQLSFAPAHWLPNQAVLMAGCADATPFLDAVVNRPVLAQLKGALVSGLFPDAQVPLQFPVLEWAPGRSCYQTECDISPWSGDLLYFGLQIRHQEQLICQAGICDNWSYVWTPRIGNRFRLEFEPDTRGRQVRFHWLDE